MGTVSPNPLILDASGRGDIWLPPFALKFVIREPGFLNNCTDGTIIYTKDLVSNTGQLLRADLLNSATGKGAGLIALFQPSSDVATTVQSALASAYVFDAGYSSLTNACYQANGRPLAVTKAWKAIASQTLACNFVFFGSGSIQSAVNSIIKITGTFSCPTGQQCLDPSLGLDGSIIFGTSSLVNEQVVPQAEWFGLSPNASASVNTLALQSAARAFPIVANGYAQGGVPIRQGAFTIGCGKFPVNGTLYLNAGDRFYSTCTTTSALLFLANGSFTGSEEFVIQVLPTCIDGIACASPTPNITHNVNIENISIDCNGANNAGASGILFYGAESSTLKKVNVDNYKMRGISFGNYASVDTFFTNFSDDIRVTDTWVVGLPGGASQGPGIYVHGNGFTFENVISQHANSFATYSSSITGTSQPNAEWMIDSATEVHIDTSYGEFDQRGMEIFQSFDIVVTNYDPGTCVVADAVDCNSIQGATAVRISGNSGNIQINGLQSYFATWIDDESSQYAAPLTRAGSSTNRTMVTYVSGYGATLASIDSSFLTFPTFTALLPPFIQDHFVYTTSAPVLTGTNCAAGILRTGAGIFTTSGSTTCTLTFPAMVHPIVVASTHPGTATCAIDAFAASSTTATFTVSNSCTVYYHIDDIQ